MNLFRTAKAKTSPKDAIVRLRESLEMLEKREKYLQTKIDNELKFAKANASKNKRGEWSWSLFPFAPLCPVVFSVLNWSCSGKGVENTDWKQHGAYGFSVTGSEKG